jgi:cytochrome c-type biogenesis protein CcmH/NrfG
MAIRWRAITRFSAAASVATALLFGQDSTSPVSSSNPPATPGPAPTGAVVSGRFTLEDGSPPPERVRVELTCNSIARPQGWTDSKGNFSVQLGVNNSDELADLSYAKSIEGPLLGMAAAVGGPPPMDVIPRDLSGCELSGVLPGYRSRVVLLTGHRRLDSPDVGTIIMRRLANVEGLTTSATTAMAPPAARKALEKATEAFKKRHPDAALKELKKAVEIYPRYALAWFDLGRVYESEKLFKEAADAYRHSVNADDRYLYPYERLCILTARQEQWPQVLELTNRVIRLDPYDFPRAYYFSAIANLNLNDLDAAEKSAQEAVTLDLPANPRAGYVLGVILARKQNFTAALDLLRAYLKAAPKSIDVEMVKRQVAELEKYVASK